MHTLDKLTETAASLTAERKKKGKKIPEDLTPPDVISTFQQQSSHPVSGCNAHAPPLVTKFFPCPSRVCTVPVSLAFCRWMFLPIRLVLLLEGMIRMSLSLIIIQRRLVEGSWCVDQ